MLDVSVNKGDVVPDDQKSPDVVVLDDQASPNDKSSVDAVKMTVQVY